MTWVLLRHTLAIPYELTVVRLKWPNAVPELVRWVLRAVGRHNKAPSWNVVSAVAEVVHCVSSRSICLRIQEIIVVCPRCME